MTRVIHTGDTHVGYRQYHSPERRADFLRAFERVIEDAVADDVDAVVHAGDLFHDRRPGLVDIQGVIGALRDLADAGIPFLAVVGNHETKRDGQWLDLFEDLGLATRLGADPVRIGDTAFYGLDFVPRSRREDLDYEFEAADAAHTALVSHGLFEPFAHADWDTERLLSEANVEFDVLLLGDEHAAGRAELDDTLLTYSGSTERASASERDERGYNIVTFDDGVAVSRRGIDVTREFVFVDLELGAGEGEARVREAVRQHDVADAVVIVTVEGEGDPVSPAAIEELATERGALVARVNDRRERETDGDTEVSFADPDDAVRDRLAELGLSEAARDVDETVRESKVADSNVRETVERHVRERLEAGDLSAFEGAPDPGESPEVDAADTGDAADAADRAGASAETGSDTAETDSADSAETDPPECDASDPDGGSDEATPDESAPPEAAGEDGQASMEEYL
jgi:DNA repair exonuclease SbcCD nuclease subunit